MRNSFIKSILVPLTALGLAGLFAQACSGGENTNTGSGTPNGCIPGTSVACVCTDGRNGAQSCNAEGNGYGSCDCNGGGTGGSGGSGGGGDDVTCVPGGSAEVLCGNGTVDPGEECDDGNCEPTDECSDKCKKPYCGDKIVQPGEDCDDGQNEVGDMCPNDCKLPDAGTDAPIDPCVGKVIFSGFAAAPSGPQWAFGGSVGYDGGTKQCQAIGAAGVCDYEQLKEIFTNPAAHPVDMTKLATAVPAGTTITAWVNRTTPETVNGVVSQPGPGGTCNNWTYTTNHLSDGEYVTITNTAGAVSGTFTLDSDTVYTTDPQGHAQAGLDCNGSMRYIPCCFPICQSN
ncbi:DUF4215 domain-containing protein [Polyangium sp. 6x1]|uniref:DUF4215 domain-containing protein n=1 Tax=Polyangium sp. 6x1 TaxID=3042689 RepID=UPI002482EF21|nr:DUF4215 domain-containing protein [Polyangium sp. 6x1]MDI1443899.1 DUF4215 domain-containing protein [Polyangium sp. 6x1]